MRRVTGMVGATIFIIGCSGEPAERPIVVDSGSYHHYVATSVQVPTTPEEQVAFALNVDGDPDGKPDNKLGNVFVLLGENNVDIQSANDDAVAAGTLAMLHSVRADSLAADGSVSWQVFVGDPAGDGYALRSDAGQSVEAIGGIRDGVFSGGPGAADVQIAVSTTQPLLTLPLIGVHIEATVNALGCHGGRLGGALTTTALEETLVPLVVNMFNYAIARDCVDGVCEPDSSGATISVVFDDNGDGTVTAEELLANQIFQSLTSPDLDLLDADGTFRPGVDGVRDSISFGMAFECAPADFEVPAEVSP